MPNLRSGDRVVYTNNNGHYVPREERQMPRIQLLPGDTVVYRCNNEGRTSTAHLEGRIGTVVDVIPSLDSHTVDWAESRGRESHTSGIISCNLQRVNPRAEARPRDFSNTVSRMVTARKEKASAED